MVKLSTAQRKLLARLTKESRISLDDEALHKSVVEALIRKEIATATKDGYLELADVKQHEEDDALSLCVPPQSEILATSQAGQNVRLFFRAGPDKTPLQVKPTGQWANEFSFADGDAGRIEFAHCLLLHVFGERAVKYAEALPSHLLPFAGQELWFCKAGALLVDVKDALEE